MLRQHTNGNCRALLGKGFLTYSCGRVSAVSSRGEK